MLAGGQDWWGGRSQLSRTLFSVYEWRRLWSVIEDVSCCCCVLCFSELQIYCNEFIESPGWVRVCAHTTFMTLFIFRVQTNRTACKSQNTQTVSLDFLGKWGHFFIHCKVKTAVQNSCLHLLAHSIITQTVLTCLWCNRPWHILSVCGTVAYSALLPWKTSLTRHQFKNQITAKYRCIWLISLISIVWTALRAWR